MGSDYQIYRVGGAVRDRLLGLTPVDDDYVVVGATVEQMQAQGFMPVGKDFPVFLHPVTKASYALARTEKKISVGHQGFLFQADPSVTLEQDLLRRDLTINAIATPIDCEISPAHLIDPYAGYIDLQQKILRHVSPAFSEDPLRVLRVARFAARFEEFQVAPQTLELMHAMVQQGTLAELSKERMWQEWLRALNEKNPLRFFELLLKTKAFYLWPQAQDFWRTKLGINESGNAVELTVSRQTADPGSLATLDLQAYLTDIKGSISHWLQAQNYSEGVFEKDAQAEQEFLSKINSALVFAIWGYFTYRQSTAPLQAFTADWGDWPLPTHTRQLIEDIFHCPIECIDAAVDDALSANHSSKPNANGNDGKPLNVAIIEAQQLIHYLQAIDGVRQQERWLLWLAFWHYLCLQTAAKSAPHAQFKALALSALQRWQSIPEQLRALKIDYGALPPMQRKARMWQARHSYLIEWLQTRIPSL